MLSHRLKAVNQVSNEYCKLLSLFIYRLISIKLVDKVNSGKEIRNPFKTIRIKKKCVSRSVLFEDVEVQFGSVCHHIFLLRYPESCIR